jgi:hypothetical protein
LRGLGNKLVLTNPRYAEIHVVHHLG